MRVAIAGTHRVGKTTLVEAFAVAHPEFEVVPEPYEQLLEEGAEGFLDELSPESFLAQLARAADRLATAGPATIFDRSPLDFLAYLRAVDELRLGSGGWDLPRESLAPAAASLARLDIIGYIPLPPSRRTRSRPGLRSLVDRHLARLALGRARPARRARLSPGRPAGRAGAVAPGSAGKHHARGGSPVPLALLRVGCAGRWSGG